MHLQASTDHHVVWALKAQILRWDGAVILLTESNHLKPEVSIYYSATELSECYSSTIITNL